MKWYDSLYLGDSVRHPRRLKRRIRRGTGAPGAYVIVLTSNEHNLLEVFQARKRELIRDRLPGGQELHIIGMAYGYGEALEVVRRIIEETYDNTGDVNVREWLRQKRRERT